MNDLPSDGQYINSISILFCLSDIKSIDLISKSRSFNTICTSHDLYCYAIRIIQNFRQHSTTLQAGFIMTWYLTLVISEQHYQLHALFLCLWKFVVEVWMDKCIRRIISTLIKVLILYYTEQFHKRNWSIKWSMQQSQYTNTANGTVFRLKWFFLWLLGKGLILLAIFTCEPLANCLLALSNRF